MFLPGLLLSRLSFLGPSPGLQSPAAGPGAPALALALAQSSPPLPQLQQLEQKSRQARKKNQRISITGDCDGHPCAQRQRRNERMKYSFTRSAPQPDRGAWERATGWRALTASKITEPPKSQANGVLYFWNKGWEKELF